MNCKEMDKQNPTPFPIHWNIYGRTRRCAKNDIRKMTTCSTLLSQRKCPFFATPIPPDFAILFFNFFFCVSCVAEDCFVTNKKQRERERDKEFKRCVI